MQLPQPYLHTSPRMVAQIDQPYSAPAEGPVAVPTFGYHTLWIAEIPFIPAQMDKEGRDFGSDASSRFTYVTQRQIRFLNNLAQLTDDLATFELRFVSWPQPNGFARVGLAFVGKVFHQDEQASRQRALGLWDRFSAIFPAEAPFSYPLVPLQHVDGSTVDQPRSFMHWYQPFPFERLQNVQSIIEIRKHEDWPTVRESGNVLHARDYIPYPFVPAIDYSAMSRLLETIAHQQQMTIVSVTLRPQRLTPQEEIILHNLASWYQRAAKGQIAEVTEENPLLRRWRHLEGNSADAYRRPRAEFGWQVYKNLVSEMKSLFLIRLQVIGERFAQDDVIQALGSEVMANADNPHPDNWERVQAQTSEEFAWVRSNAQWLEFARWGISPRVQRDRRIIRLRQLATVAEAAGAFRLPIAPTTATLAGVDVRDEPFALSPSSNIFASDESNVYCRLGTIQDRGVTTNIPFSLPLGSRATQLDIFGDRGDIRDQVVQQLFNSATTSGTTGATRVLLRRGNGGETMANALAAHYLSFDTDGQVMPLFSPFSLPPHVALPSFVDALLRVFLVAYRLDSAVSAVLRQALLTAYQQSSTDVDLATIAMYIDSTARQMALPSEITSLLCTRCTLPLRDLAQMFPLPTSTAMESLLSSDRAIVIDVGEFGSDMNTALVYGSVWAWLTLALSAIPVPSVLSSNAHRLLAIEDAHVLLAPTDGQQFRQLSSPLATILDTCTSGGIHVLLIDDQPHHLDEQVIAKAHVTILIQSRSLNAIEKVGTELRLSTRQQARLARLHAAEAMISVRGTTPVLITLSHT